jgi:MFS family permease
MSRSVAAGAPPNSVLVRIAPFVFVIFCTYLTIGMPLAAIPLQVHDILGFDNLTVGITVGIQSLMTLLTRQFAGSLCDRRGAKYGVLLGGGVAIAAGGVSLLSTSSALGVYASLGVLLSSRLVLGLAESLLMTGSLAWGVSVAGAANTGKVMVWVGIGLYAGIAVGAPIGVQLMSHKSLAYQPLAHHSLFDGLMGGFAGVSIGIVIFSMLATACVIFIPRAAPLGGERMPFMRVAGRVAPFGAGLALATIGFGAIGAFAALDFHHKGWSGEGFVLTGFGVAYIFTRVVFGGWPDRFGGARVAVWSLLIECIGQVMLWLAPGPAVAFAGAILTGVGFALVFPSFGIEAVRQVPPANRGAALGAYAAFFDVGFGLAGPMNGLIAGAFGYPWVFAAGAFGTIAAMLAARRASARVAAASD